MIYKYTLEEQIDYTKYYRPKRYITTITENIFYNILLDITKELDLILYSQVSLYAIVEVKEDFEKKFHDELFDEIKAKTIDFVLVDKKTNKIKLCIELDDNSHNEWKRIQRDNFINKLFKDLKIPLLRYPTYKNYYKETLKKRIQENLKITYYEN